MHQHYADILSRITEQPQWFDENGVPRYGRFHPDKLANIYATECALLDIACQACGRTFFVAIDTRNALANAHDYKRAGPHFVLADLIRRYQIHYGDPPNIRCCAGGPSMNSTPRRVLEYWHRGQTTYTTPGSATRYISPSALEWQRDGSLEIEIPSGD